MTAKDVRSAITIDRLIWGLIAVLLAASQFFAQDLVAGLKGSMRENTTAIKEQLERNVARLEVGQDTIGRNLDSLGRTVNVNAERLRGVEVKQTIIYDTVQKLVDKKFGGE